MKVKDNLEMEICLHLIKADLLIPARYKNQTL